jgi:hypothetical protein
VSDCHSAPVARIAASVAASVAGIAAVAGSVAASVAASVARIAVVPGSVAACDAKEHLLEQKQEDWLTSPTHFPNRYQLAGIFVSCARNPAVGRAEVQVEVY